MFLTQTLSTLLALCVGIQAKCNADNCYRAMFPCRPGLETAWSSASQFCATITAHGTTATNYPTRATSACGSSPARYISVCTCGDPTCTPQPPQPSCTGTPRPSGALYYNDFECALPAVQVNDVAVRYGNISPGFTGSKAFEVWLIDTHWEANFPLWARFNNIAVTKNAPVRLTFQVIFTPGADSGSLRIEADGVLQQFVFASLDSPIWTLVTVDYTPQADTTNFAIGFHIDSQNAHLRIDNVLLKYRD